MPSWSQVYKRGMGQTGGIDNISLAVVAIKKELRFMRYQIADLDGHFGRDLTKQVKLFQTKESLTSDGVVGPNTAKALFLPRVELLEASYSIPGKLLCGLAAHESSFDPGAYGSVDPDDKGLTQINIRIHTDISLQQAFTPYFALTYAATFLKDQHQNFLAPCTSIAWDCAVVAWNSPRNAQDWCSSGSPNAAAQAYIDAVRTACT